MNIFRLAFAAATFAAIATSVSAQDCVNDVDQTVLFSRGGQTVQTERLLDYTAVIAPRDLTNSKGTRLANFAAILQQDRANLHKSGTGDSFGDYRETADSYFTSLKRRSFLSRARYFTYCGTDIADITDQIMNADSARTIIWLVVFRHPDGNPAIFIDQAG